MGSWLGVDWAGGCWVVVRYGEDALITTEPSILNIWHEYGNKESIHAIVVDIPIGLPSSDSRVCDQEARDRLGSRRNTIFPIPHRDVVEADDYDTARELNNNSLGSQSWWLFPRIREVDVFLQHHPAALEKTYESHPELCYYELSKEQLKSKDTESGIDARLAIIDDVIDDSAGFYDTVRTIVQDRNSGAEWHDRISKTRRDDVLDAAILAITGSWLDLDRRSRMDNYPSLPEKTTPQRDTKLDISPEIIYPK